VLGSSKRAIKNPNKITDTIKYGTKIPPISKRKVPTTGAMMAPIVAVDST